MGFTPTPGGSLPTSPLTEIGINLASMERDFIATRVLPPMAHRQRYGERLVYDNKTAMQIVATERGVDGELNEIRAFTRRQPFSMGVHGLVFPIDDLERSELEVDYDVNLDMEAAQILMSYLLLSQEAETSSLVFNTATFAPVTGVDAGEVFHSVGPAINNDITVDVNGFVRDAHAAVRAQIGQSPNAVVCSHKTYLALGVNTKVLERVIYTNVATPFTKDAEGRILLDTKALAQLFQVEEFIVGDAQYDAAPEGNPLNLTELWGPDFMLFMRKKKGVSLKVPCLGVTWHWDIWSGPDGRPVIIAVYRNQDGLSDKVQAIHAREPQVFNARAGHLYTGIDT